MADSYSKHKDRRPEDTIFKIQGILNSAGLFPVLKWADNDFETAVSNRVTLYPAAVGSNGKGTDKRYAAASAYAELVERLQNNILWILPEYTASEATKKAGFVFFPDEKVMTVSELLDQNCELFSVTFAKIGMIDRKAQEKLISNYEKLTPNYQAGKVTVVPFTDPSNNRIVWLPYSFIKQIFASNGMASGNTIEEAMVQGLSEIFERWVNFQIIEGQAVPPEVPRDYLEKFAISNLIKDFESSGRYTVKILDCTLGRGFPVAGAIITDKENGSMSIKMGSHPSFSVAVERTLTEAAQSAGKLEFFTKLCRLGTDEQVQYMHNAVNVMKNGKGIYPYGLMLKKPNWEFVPWEYTEKASNTELLEHMFKICRREGFNLLVRDASFLGFPACFIIIPEISELYTHKNAEERYRLMNTVINFLPSFEKFPYLTYEEEKKLLNIINFNEYSELENSISYSLVRPFKGKRMTSERVAAFLALKHGDYKLSKHYFEKMYAIEQDEAEKKYLHAMVAYARYLKNGLSNDEAHRLLRQLFTEEISSRVINETQDLKTVMERNFPHMNCFDCEHCELAGKECMNNVEKEQVVKLFTAMRKENVSQERLLERLLEMMKEK